MADMRLIYSSPNGSDTDSDGFPYSQFVKNLYKKARRRPRVNRSPTMSRIIMETSSLRTYDPHSPMDAFCLLLKSLNPKYHKFYYFLCILAGFAILAYVTYLKYY
ncbi:uncharacterized protein LOC133848823 [Drosophila sulfurigaster albostrigata]|uniref:uncharacterized protein LOC133848823 n=1 Tax=Drosophila sulfurigaster albostrigata TaxID=89887 RepID=UPI002D21E815|nr:uncharacterized protein LOC133848823 [Drosophila sulfurigaster albostrigata]